MEELKSNSFSGRDYNPVYASASSGDIKAQVKLGCMYRDGDGVDKDGNKAVEWLTKAAEQGSSDAQCILGRMYSDGDGVVLSYSKALAWYTLAADQGDADALVSLGVLYNHGRGVSKDYSKAAEYYAMAAAMGDSYGEFNLGALYRDGLGVPKDDQKAFEYLSKSAEKGNEYAQYSLGDIYFQRHDYEKGKQYFRLAAEQGSKAALEKLNVREGLEAKQKEEDSIKKITCPFCGKQSVWKAKFCHGCTARITYEPIREYEWIGIGLGIIFAVVGIAIDPNHIGMVLFYAFIIWWLSIMLGKFFGKQRAMFSKD